MSNWIPKYFGLEYLVKYKEKQSKEQTQREVDFLIKALDIQKQDWVLDIPSGYGRHTNELLDRGIRTVGVDISKLFIEEAKKYSPDRQGMFFVGDMRNIKLKDISLEPFDYIFNFFTSFGYYDDVVNELIIHNISNMLKAGGKFLLDVGNREWLIQHFIERQWDDYSDRIEAIDRSFDLKTSRMNTKIIYCYGDKRKIVNQSIRFYTLTEIIGIFSRHGLKVIQTYGNIDFGDYTKDSKRMIVIGEKSNK